MACMFVCFQLSHFCQLIWMNWISKKYIMREFSSKIRFKCGPFSRKITHVLPQKDTHTQLYIWTKLKMIFHARWKTHRVTTNAMVAAKKNYLFSHVIVFVGSIWRITKNRWRFNFQSASIYALKCTLPPSSIYEQKLQLILGFFRPEVKQICGKISCNFLYNMKLCFEPFANIRNAKIIDFSFASVSLPWKSVKETHLTPSWMKWNDNIVVVVFGCVHCSQILRSMFFL